MKVDFLTTLDLRLVSSNAAGDTIWMVVAPFFTIIDDGEPTQRILRTPSGFLTDLASIPRLPLVYLQFANKAVLPSVAHDDLYRRGGNNADREYADQVFLAGMLSTGMTPEDAQAMFAGVRKFGARHFNFTAGEYSVELAPAVQERQA